MSFWKQAAGIVRAELVSADPEGALRALEPAQWYSNSGDLCAAGLYRSENCGIKQKSPGTAGALVLFHVCGRCGRGAAGGAEDYEERSRSD